MAQTIINKSRTRRGRRYQSLILQAEKSWQGSKSSSAVGGAIRSLKLWRVIISIRKKQFVHNVLLMTFIFELILSFQSSWARSTSLPVAQSFRVVKVHWTQRKSLHFPRDQNWIFLFFVCPKHGHPSRRHGGRKAESRLTRGTRLVSPRTQKTLDPKFKLQLPRKRQSSLPITHTRTRTQNHSERIDECPPATSKFHLRKEKYTKSFWAVCSHQVGMNANQSNSLIWNGAKGHFKDHCFLDVHLFYSQHIIGIVWNIFRLCHTIHTLLCK